MKHLLASPAYSQDEKLAVLAEICRRMQCPPIVESFLSPLVAKSRAGMLPEIADAFGIIADEAKGAKHLTVQSPTPLSGAEQDQLRTRLRDVLKRNVEVTFETNPTLLAGVYLQMGSLVVDSTLRGRLDAMRSQLSKE
jgi:F-type H+-transporting ATPase subunit delta